MVPAGSGGPAGDRHRWIHQIALKGDQHGLGAVFGIQFAQQRSDAVLGGFNGEMELISNFLVAQAAAEAPQLVFFPQAEHIAEANAR